MSAKWLGGVRLLLLLLVAVNPAALWCCDASPAKSVLEAALTARSSVGFRSMLRITSTLEAAVSDHAGLLSASELRRVIRLPAAAGTYVVRLKQFWNDTEVYDGDVSVHVDESETEVYDVQVGQSSLRAGAQEEGAALVAADAGAAAAPGLLIRPLTLPQMPRVAASTALHITANAFGFNTLQLSKYAWNRSIRLVYYAVGEKKLAPALCYIVEFFIHLPNNASPSSPHAIVDSLDGTIVDSWEGIPTLGTQSKITGIGGNSGPVWGLQNYADVPVTQLNSTSCSYSTNVVRIQNMHSATSSSSFVDALLPCSQAASSTYDATNGAYAPLNDVARHAQAVYDMFTTLLSVPPTISLPMLVRAHYGTQYENAYWDGTQVNVGDGGRSLYPLVSVDLIGHEFAHALTNAYSALQYSGQSGGVNEAYSDMAGETAEYFLYGANDFVIGKNITKNGQGVRYMCNPTADQLSIDNALDYSSTLDVHYSCGVFNKAFCILSTMPGWDIETTFVVFSYANVVYWQQLTNFTGAACGVQKSARALGLPVSNVTSAFLSVGISVNC